MYGYIYKTTNLVNGKIYIGQHKSANFDARYYGSGLLLCEALKKYGKDNFTIEVIEECASKKELDEKEIYYIHLFDAMNSDIGYNLSLGGTGGDIYNSLSIDRRKIAVQKCIETKEKNGTLHIAPPCVGHPLSLETRKLLSELKKGTTRTEEAKKKISLASKKWWENASKEKKEERSRKLSEKEKGKVISDEQRKKLSESHKGRKSATKGKVCITNNINNKYVFENEVNYYLQLGYHLGSNQKGKIVSQETRDKLSSKLKGKPTCTLGRVRMNNGKCIKYVKKEDVPYYLNNGYVIGGPNTFNKKK